MAGPGRRPGIAAALTGLVLDRGCAGCEDEDLLLCDACQAELEQPPILARLDPVPAGMPETWAAAAYAGAVRSMLLAHKEDGRLALARPLGHALARATAAAAPGVDDLTLVPVPSQRSTVRARGQDATLRVARVAARELRASGRRVVLLPVLRPVRRVADQAGLSQAERSLNLAGALAVPPGRVVLVRGHRVVVVDDVVTTGATLAEAARAVRRAGADVVAGAAVAATARRSGASPGSDESRSVIDW